MKIHSENRLLQVGIVAGADLDKQVLPHHLWTSDGIVSMSNTLISHLTITMVPTDETDACGRQKFRSLTPQEIVSRAMEIATLAYKTWEETGHMLAMPPISSLVKDEGSPAGFRA